MKAINKFYISSFLKNQTYFVPILIVFLQAQSLDYSQIFWVFTIGSILSFVMEIPTGIFADFYGKKRSVIISKALIFLSFISFGFADSFWLFVLAQCLFELGNSFRTGTETAFIFDFLKQNKDQPGYTEVKGKQKFWARTGESIATATGGVIAASLGFSWVFFIAAIPAFLNIINAASWPEIKERRMKKFRIKPAIEHTQNSFRQLFSSKRLMVIVGNITIFTAVLAAMTKFLQPYMIDAGIPIEYFGFIYAASLAISALAVRYSYKVENAFGARKTVNTLTVLAAVPAVIIGTGFLSVIGAALFFLITIVENIRSPIANHSFNKLISSRERATLGSVLSQSKSLGKMIVLPLAGYIAEAYTLAASVFVLSLILVLNGTILYFRR